MESTTRSTLTTVRELLADVADRAVWTSDPTELSSLLDELHLIGNIRDAIELKVVRQADACEVAKTVEATSTTSWLAEKQRIDPRQADKKVKLAAHLERHLPATQAALAAGEISVDQAQIIATALTKLPKEAPVADVDKTLTEYAKTLGPVSLRKLANHALDVIAPDLSDQVQKAKLDKEEREAEKVAAFHLTKDRDSGLWRINAWVDKVTGERLELLIQDRSRPEKGADGPHLRSAAQRRAAAFAELVELAHNHSDTTHGGNRTQLVVVLRPGTDVGVTLHSGQELSPDLVEQLRCEADVSYVMPEEYAPGQLHLTDPQRLFTGKLRRMLELRDGGCAFPGCDRPPGWTHAHHIDPWAKGGKTTLANGVLLCGYHHRAIHRGDWAVRMARDGLPEFIPPPWIDPDQAPMRNPIHQL